MLQISINILLALHVIVSLLLLLVVLMQRPKNEGLGAAFGGGMTDNLFGAQTTHVLSKFTVYLGGAFFALTLLLAILYSKQSTTGSSFREELAESPAPPAAETVSEIPPSAAITEEEVVNKVEEAISEATAPEVTEPEATSEEVEEIANEAADAAAAATESAEAATESVADQVDSLTQEVDQALKQAQQAVDEAAEATSESADVAPAAEVDAAETPETAPAQ